MRFTAYFHDMVPTQPTVKRRDTVRIFRARLAEAMARAGHSRAELARAVDEAAPRPGMAVPARPQ